MLLGLWKSHSQWGDRDLVTARTAASLPYVESTLREMQRESRQFQMLALRELGIRTPQLGREIEIYPRSRVDALEVYRRPARDAQKVLDGGGSLDDAWAAFEKRLNGIIEADIAITERDEIDLIQERLIEEDLFERLERDLDALDLGHPVESASDGTDLMDRDDMLDWLDADEDPELAGHEGGEKKVIGFRRVIRPELSKNGSCGLCVVAATNWYTFDELKPIHNLCKCVTVPVVKGADPGFGWNQEDLRKNLDEIYGAAGGSTYGKDLKRIRVKITEHGELGPILEYRSKRWVDSDAADMHRPMYERPTRAEQAQRLNARRDELLETIDNLRARLNGGGDRGGIEHAIWEVEQSIRDIDARINN